ncbi:MAG TPA: hypothetical protein VG501_00835 [Rhizomicrobium sp.]|nr:hypothetical protein [Rhizomicrobium sp.]
MSTPRKTQRAVICISRRGPAEAARQALIFQSLFLAGEFPSKFDAGQRGWPIMIILIAGLAAAFLSVSPAMAQDWHWVWTVPGYYGADNSRLWTSVTGTVDMEIQGGRFKVHLENSNQEPNFDISGVITGAEVSATAREIDTDNLPQHFHGTFAVDRGSRRIVLTSPRGDFIGLIETRPASPPPRSR